jgi:hypothetical protein
VDHDRPGMAQVFPLAPSNHFRSYKFIQGFFPYSRSLASASDDYSYRLIGEKLKTVKVIFKLASNFDTLERQYNEYHEYYIYIEHFLLGLRMPMT